jgi:signal transduction histidine kinase
MSHEMLTPLNSILHLTDYVQEKVKDKYEEDEGNNTGEMGSSIHDNASKEMKVCVTYLGIVKSSANILQFLVKDLIDLMNIKGKSFISEVKGFSTREACEEVIKCYKM